MCGYDNSPQEPPPESEYAEPLPDRELKPADLVGCLLLIRPLEHGEAETVRGVKPFIDSEVTILDGRDFAEGVEVRWWQDRVVKALRPRVGIGPVLGRLDRGASGTGPYRLLPPASDKDRQLARDYLKNIDREGET
jgi:hypothetical protein